MRAYKQSHLRCFVSVAESGSVSAAAKRLHRTPSAISMMLSQLESLLEKPLFEPGSKARLTPFGAYVFDLAREQLQHFERSMESIRAYARNEIGRIDIAAVPSFAAHYLPGLLAEFIGRYPKVDLSIRDDSSAQINRLVEQGLVDVGIASPAGEFPTLTCRPLFSDPLGVVCSRTHPLTVLDRPISWADLEGYRFIANGTCALIEAAEFRRLLESADLDVQNTTSLLALVAAGFGITTLPRLAVPGERRDIVFRTTCYDGLERGIGILTSSGRTLAPAAQAFVDMVVASLVDEKMPSPQTKGG